MSFVKWLLKRVIKKKNRGINSRNSSVIEDWLLSGGETGAIEWGNAASMRRSSQSASVNSEMSGRFDSFEGKRRKPISLDRHLPVKCGWCCSQLFVGAGSPQRAEFKRLEEESSQEAQHQEEAAFKEVEMVSSTSPSIDSRTQLGGRSRGNCWLAALHQLQPQWIH